jgi:hypothetical protein
MHRERFFCHRGNLKISGHIWGGERQAKPAVILCHGFLANEKMCHDYAQMLVGLGYVAITFDFCGGGLMSKSQGKTEDMTILSEMNDLIAVINYVKGQSFVNPDRVTLLGCSLGGLVCAMVAKQLKGEIERLILLYPALCIPDDARQGKMLFYKYDPQNVPDIIGKFPMKLGGDYARTAMKLDVFSEIGGFDGEVLLLHGTKDDVVDISYSRKAKGYYAHCRYAEIENGGHMFKGKAEQQAKKLMCYFMRLEV